VRELMAVYIIMIALHLLGGFVCSSLLYYKLFRTRKSFAVLFGVLTTFSANFLYGKGFASFVIIVNLLPVALYLIHRAVISKNYLPSAFAGLVTYLITVGGVFTIGDVCVSGTVLVFCFKLLLLQ
jgi:hypothetical protein